MADPGMNLLPEELRKPEERELKRPVSSPASAGYSAPTSEFEERLREVSSPSESFWHKVKAWFSTVPPPSGGTPVLRARSQQLPPPPPLKRATTSGPPPAPATAPRVQPAPPAAPVLRVQPPPPTPPKPMAPPAKVVKGPPPPIPLGILLDVNLLPGDARAAAASERAGLKLLIIGGAIVLVLGIAYATLSSLVVGRASRLASVEQDVGQFQKEVETLQGQINDAELAGRKMEGLSSVLKMRPDWGKFLGKLESLTLRSTNYTALSADANGEFTIGAEASTVTDLAKQLLAFEQATDVVARVSMGSVALTDSSADRPSAARTTFQLQLVPGWLAVVPQPANRTRP